MKGTFLLRVATTIIIIIKVLGRGNGVGKAQILRIVYKQHENKDAYCTASREAASQVSGHLLFRVMSLQALQLILS